MPGIPLECYGGNRSGKPQAGNGMVVKSGLVVDADRLRVSIQQEQQRFA
jgi:hypothetical protein